MIKPALKIDVNFVLNLDKMIQLLNQYLKSSINLSNQTLLSMAGLGSSFGVTKLPTHTVMPHANMISKLSDNLVSEKTLDQARSCNTSGQKLPPIRPLSGKINSRSSNQKDPELNLDEISVGGADDDPQEFYLSGSDFDGESDDQSLSVFYNNIVDHDDYTMYLHGFENRSSIYIT